MLDLTTDEATAALDLLGATTGAGLPLAGTLTSHLERLGQDQAMIVVDGTVDGGAVIVIADHRRALLSVFDPRHASTRTDHALCANSVRVAGHRSPYAVPIVEDQGAVHRFTTREHVTVATAFDTPLGGGGQMTQLIAGPGQGGWWLSWWDEWAGLPFAFAILLLPDRSRLEAALHTAVTGAARPDPTA